MSAPRELTGDLIARAMGLIEESFIASAGPGGQNVNKVCKTPPDLNNAGRCPHGYDRAMTKAYSFIRFSSPAQMKGDSLRRQLAKAERFAAGRDLDLDTSYRALGISAFTGKHRVKGALAAFLNAVRAGEIEKGSWLLVENVDRLSRETPWDAMGLLREIIEAGLTVATLMDDMIYDLPTLRKRPEHLQTLNAAFTKGHRESADKSDRLHEAWSEKRTDLQGRRKLTRQGPRWVDLVSDDPLDPLVGEFRLNKRADVVLRLYQMCASGIGKELIARRLNEDGTDPFRGGDGWQASTVLFLLRDRRAIGEFQPHTKVDGVRRPVGDPIPAYFPAAVPEELFYAVQTELSRRHTGAHPGKKKRVPNIFVGLARCSCGRAMEYRDKSGRKHRSEKAIYLICSGAQRGHACSNSHHHTYSELESLVLDWVSDIQISDKEGNNATITSIKHQAKIAERDDLKRRIADAMAKWDALSNGLIKDTLFASAERNARTLVKVEAEIVELDQIIRSTKRSVLDDRRDIVGRMRNEMRTLDGEALFDARAKLASALRQVIDHLEFQGDGIFRVTLIGGLKLYHFAAGRHHSTFDLSDENPDNDELLKFPSASLKDSLNWPSQTLAGVRDALEALVEGRVFHDAG